MLFQYDLDRAKSDPDDLGYLSQIDFVDSCYAYPSGRKLYPYSPICVNWFVNGFMMAWRKHFLEDEERGGEGNGGIERGETGKHS